MGRGSEIDPTRDHLARGARQTPPPPESINRGRSNEADSSTACCCPMCRVSLAARVWFLLPRCKGARGPSIASMSQTDGAPRLRTPSEPKAHHDTPYKALARCP